MAFFCDGLCDLDGRFNAEHRTRSPCLGGRHYTSIGPDLSVALDRTPNACVEPGVSLEHASRGDDASERRLGVGAACGRLVENTLSGHRVRWSIASTAVDKNLHTYSVCR